MTCEALNRLYRRPIRSKPLSEVGLQAMGVPSSFALIPSCGKAKLTKDDHDIAEVKNTCDE